MGRPPKFSRTQVQQAALKVVDQDGLNELTMRAVATALGTGPMTIYRHVQDRADLEVLVVDAVFAEVELPGAAATWQRSVEEVCTASWKSARRHPHAAPLVLTRRGQSRAALSVGEALVSAMRDSGLNGPDLVIAFRTLLAVIVGGVDTDPRHADGSTFDEAFHELLGADPNPFPGVSAMVAVAETMSPEEIFHGTVRRAIDGIDANLRGRANRPPP